jgi:hypothetical protein
MKLDQFNLSFILLIRIAQKLFINFFVLRFYFVFSLLSIILIKIGLIC